MTAPLKFEDYVAQLAKIEYFKYDIILNYFDLKFKYKNVSINDDIEYKIEVNGVVDYIEKKEYNIFTDTRSGQAASTWIIRIPEILNNKNTYWNSNLSQNSNNVSYLPDLQYITPGLNYETVTGPTIPGIASTPSSYIGLYRTANIGPDGKTIILKTGPNGPDFVDTATENLIATYVATTFPTTKQHPCLDLIYDPDSDEPQKYFKVPVGISGYKIILTNLVTREKVVSELVGTLQDNPAYSPVTVPIVYTEPIAPGNFGTLTLNNSTPSTPTIGLVPNLIGLSRSAANTKILEIGCIPRVTVGDPTPIRSSLNTVYEQYPDSGTTVPAGSNIDVTVHGHFSPVQGQ